MEEAQERRQITLILHALDHLLGSLEGSQRLTLHCPHICILNVVESTHRVILLDLSNNRRDILVEVLAQLEGIFLLTLLGSKLLNPLLI